MLSLPSVPNVLEMPVVIDQRLLDSDFINLNAGTEATVVQLARAASRARKATC